MYIKIILNVKLTWCVGKNYIVLDLVIDILCPKKQEIEGLQSKQKDFLCPVPGRYPGRITTFRPLEVNLILPIP